MMFVQSVSSTSRGNVARTDGVAMGVEVTLGEALELGVVLAVADGVGDGAGLADELGVELGVELGEGLWPGDGVVVVASEGSVDELAEGLGVALASGDESSMKVSVRFSGVANARTENVPFWIPGRISIRSMTAGAARVKVISVPAPHDVLGPEAQKVVKSDPTSATAGLPYPVEFAVTSESVTGEPVPGFIQ